MKVYESVHENWFLFSDECRDTLDRLISYAKVGFFMEIVRQHGLEESNCDVDKCFGGSNIIHDLKVGDSGNLSLVNYCKFLERRFLVLQLLRNIKERVYSCKTACSHSDYCPPWQKVLKKWN